MADIKSGVIQKPLKIGFHRALIDPATCQTFTEVIVTDQSHPYVIGMRLRINHAKIAEIESLVTQQGDWLFNADNYFKWSPGEDWEKIPAGRRDTRDPCPGGIRGNHTEGGICTGKGLPGRLLPGRRAARSRAALHS